MYFVSDCSAAGNLRLLHEVALGEVVGRGGVLKNMQKI